MVLTKICQILSKKDLPPEWQGEYPVLCVAGRSLIDEAAAIMLAQLSTSHGLAARFEPAEALSTANVFRLETTGVAIVCLIYMDAGAPAHMRYSVRRLRRKLPKATIVLGCWMKDMEPRRWKNSGIVRKQTSLLRAWAKPLKCVLRRRVWKALRRQRRKINFPGRRRHSNAAE